MKRIHNFSAGPAALPEPVLKKVADEFLSYRGLGYSIIETSHRSKVFETLLEETQAGLKKLMRLDETYEVLFLHGGATTDFYRIPLNFLTSPTDTADYINTGNWSGKAIKTAKKTGLGKICIAGSSEDKNFSYIPQGNQLSLQDKSRYVYLCSNNTLYGTQFHEYPDTGSVPLVGDFTSDIFSREMDYRQFSLIFASAQKNLGPAGGTIAVIKKDFLTQARADIPNIDSYRKIAEANSRLNTPPVFVIYVINEVMKWIETEGGITAIEKRNRQKSDLLYEYLDHTSFYRPVAESASRSIMNVTYHLPSQELTDQFIKEAEGADIVQIKGHRLAGGIRASIYNGMKLESVEKLIDFMKKFEKTHAAHGS